MRSASAPRMSKPRQPAWPKFVAPLDAMTPSRLAGPGVSRPTARTDVRGKPVSSSTCCTEPTSEPMALSGPSLTLLGTSARWSRRIRPLSSRIVPLFMVPPLSRPTTTQSTDMRPPRPVAKPGQVYGNDLAESNIARRRAPPSRPVRAGRLGRGGIPPRLHVKGGVTAERGRRGEREGRVDLGGGDGFAAADPLRLAVVGVGQKLLRLMVVLGPRHGRASLSVAASITRADAADTAALVDKATAWSGNRIRAGLLRAMRRIGDLNPGRALTLTALAVRRHRPD